MTADQLAGTGEGQLAWARGVFAVNDLCQIAAEAESVEGVYEAALTALERAIGVERSSILVFDRQGVMRFGGWRGLSKAYRTAVDGHSPWSADAKDPEPILVPDVALDPELAPLCPVFDAERIVALAFIPLIHAGRLLGKFMLYYDTPHLFAEEEVRVASSIAQFVAGAVDRKRNEVELRRSREHLSLALEAGAMGIWEWDIATGEVVWSPTLERVHGLEPGTFSGTFSGTFEAFQRDVIPEDLPAVLAAVRRTTEDGAAYEVTYRIRRPDGALRWIETRGSAVHDETGAPVRMVGVCTDVTQRRASEVERARLLEAERPLNPDDAILAEELASRAGTAIDNARLFTERSYVAQTLQRSLLPGKLPEFDRLTLAARYLPGAVDVAAGGDWYDVLALDEHRVAIVVGDVVGRGAAAAAVMGQLRTALATALLHGDSAATALEHLDRMAARVPGALASTAAVMILDLMTGNLCWARAGHPPPLLVEPEGVRYLTDGAGGPLGIRGRPPYPEAATRIEPGACLLLYTDGLIERRGQVIDEGLDHLAATAAALCSEPPTTLLDGLLARALPDTGPADDVALIAARFLPAPLHQRLLADPTQLSGLRRAVRAWVRAAALPAALGEDLQLALGEAAANAVEHAYASTGEPGEFTCRLTHRGDGGIDVEVRDFGRWRPEPTNNSHRGRGLALIRRIATDVVIGSSPTGTHVRFRLPAPAPAELRVEAVSG